MLRDFFLAVTRNAISLLGAMLTTISAILVLTLFGIHLMGFEGGPYLGILAFLILPGVFVLGLVMIPLGAWRKTRQMRKAAAAGQAIPAFPVVDLNTPRTRRLVVIFAGLTVVNTIILALATYKGVEVMDSTPFCGSACHSVMAPEYTAYQRSPHARVKCVECHIGPGADWFAKSKLSGSWQLVAVTFDLFPRPIPTPVENLRPARETCEVCHWPSKFAGERLKVYNRYSDQEKAALQKTVVLLNIGGMQAGKATGIHWHVDPGIRIRYTSDPSREHIDDVELTQPDGKQKVFKRVAGEKDKPIELMKKDGQAVWRTMDCIDCHNRPTHIYGTPEEHVDEALWQQRLDQQLPFIHREALRLVKERYASHEEARAKIPEGLAAFYAKDFPEVAKAKADAIKSSGEELVRIYTSAVFPSMHIEWGTYPNFIGHKSSPGCWRCHGGHKADDGALISKECTSCHQLLATDDADPEILKQLHPE